MNPLFRQHVTSTAFNLTLSAHMIHGLKSLAEGNVNVGGEHTQNALVGRGLIESWTNLFDKLVFRLTPTGNAVVYLLIEAGLLDVADMYDQWTRLFEEFSKDMGNSPHKSVQEYTT